MATTIQYTVKSGDTLSKIAAQFQISLAEIETANPQINPNLIFVGQVLNIPSNNATPAPTPQPTTPTDAVHKGYWDWNWHPKPLPEGTNMGFIFSGRTNVNDVLSQADQIYDRVTTPKKFLCFGGGGQTGSFHQADLTAINTAIQSKKLSGYSGIAYDVEVGDKGLAGAFQESFATAKAAGLEVVVTVSHSCPFGIKDGVTLMHSFFEDENIDFLSPQLYTTGKEKQNDYDAAGIKWTEFADAKAAVIPSIVTGAYYADAVDHFKQWGVELKGYIQWW